MLREAIGRTFPRDRSNTDLSPEDARAGEFRFAPGWMSTRKALQEKKLAQMPVCVRGAKMERETGLEPATSSLEG